MRRPLLFAIAAGAVLATASLGPRAACGQVDTLDFGNALVTAPVIASAPWGDLMPTEGAVHVAWRRTPALIHAWKSPDPWQTETVADSALALDLAVRGNGQPVLAWLDYSGRLICGERGPSGWSRDTVASFPGSTLQISLAVDPDPVIAFSETPPGGPTKLWFARRSGGSWTLLPLDADQAGFPPSVAIGPDGPTVAYVDFAATASGRQVVLLEGAGPLGPFTPAVVDTQGGGPVSLGWDRQYGRRRPYVLYLAEYEEASFRYRLAWRDEGGAWPIENLGGAGYGPIYAGVSLALDPVGALGALWMEDADFAPQELHAPGDPDETNGSCNYIISLRRRLSRKPAGVPSEPFVTTELSNHMVNTARISPRAMSAHQIGVFDVAWKEPFISCAPYGIFYSEVPGGTTAVPIPGEALPGARLELAPNPVTSGAVLRVRWSQPRTGAVRLELHDLAGRRVADLHAGSTPQGGAEQVWTLPAMSPGLYWVSLVLDGERIARSVLVRR